MGKSTYAATTSEESIKGGWAALFLPAQDLNLAKNGEKIVYDGLGRTEDPNWRLLLVRPWAALSQSGESRGLLLIIDGAEKAPEHVIRGVTELLEAALASVPASALKVLITCDEWAVQRLQAGLAPLSGQSRITNLTLFTDTELDGGLRACYALGVKDRHVAASDRQMPRDAGR